MSDLELRRPLLDRVRAHFGLEDASDEDLAFFVTANRHMDLDPWAGHTVLVPYQGRYKVQLTVAGRRHIAQRSGRWRGVIGPEWCGPELVPVKRRDKDGNEWETLEHVWLDVWDDPDNYPHAARCFCHVADWVAPANGTVRWAEFAKYTWDEKKRESRLAATWAQMPSHMLGKVAESLALRRAFPEIQAAIAYLGEADEEAILIAEAAAPSLEAPPLGEVAATSPGPASRSAAPAPAAQRNRARTPRPDTVPPEVYDNLPEAQGYTR